jgi:predicted ATPase/class 3 adenylate cyclase
VLGQERLDDGPEVAPTFQPREVAGFGDDLDARAADERRRVRGRRHRHRVTLAVDEQHRYVEPRQAAFQRPCREMGRHGLHRGRLALERDLEPERGRRQDVAMDVRVRRPECHEHLCHQRRVVVAFGLASHQRVELGPLVRGQASDQVGDQLVAPAVRERTERLDEDEAGDTLRMRDRDVHREVAAPRVAHEPGALPAELVEQGDLVGDVRLDVARSLERAGVEAALLGQDAVDEPVDLLDEPDEMLGPDARPAVQEDRPRPGATSRGKDLAARHGSRQFLVPHARLPRNVVRRTIAEMRAPLLTGSARGPEHQRVDVQTGQLPRGTVTFLFTDIEGSTRLAEAAGDAYSTIVTVHHDLLRRETSGTGGVVVSTEGDAFFIVFARAGDAIRGAVAMQRAIATEDWPAGTTVRVRMGMHTGDAVLGGDNYAGLDVNRAARIAAAAHGGQILTSAATRELAEGELAPAIRFVDLGEHRLKDLSRPERLQQVVAGGLENSFPAPRTMTAALDLPVLLTSFVGREDELDRARRLIDDGARLVTLTGPGGTGKTRLSVQLATQLADRYPDGVHFVDLSTVGEPSMVAETIARALRLIERPDRTPADLLADHLRDRSLLLVLDNFEQVVEAAPVVADLLRVAPGLVVVATSRGPLRISGEHEFAVPPLGLPAGVALFVDRASAARSDFQLTDGNAAAIAAICARLDGLPLAIELAAARVRLLTPDAILTRLGQSLDLLDRGGRDLPARQQTLRGAIDWSHDLLDAPSRRLFARLAVFAGGATLDAIEAVCGPASDLGTDVVDGLEGLVDQSLVRGTDLHGDQRYSMLQTVHEFATERLESSGEQEAIRRRHAETYLTLAERAAPELVGSDQRHWLDLLEHEHDNLRAAIDWAMAAGETELALRLVTAPWRFWQMRGHLVEARTLIGEALARPDATTHPAAYARALGAMGGITYWLGDYETSSDRYRRALEVARSVDDRRLLAEALTDVALTIDDSGRPDDPASIAAAAASGFTVLEEARSIYRDLGDRRGEAGVLWTIGTAYSFLDDLPNAARFLSEGAQLAEASGDLFHASWATYMLASVARRRGDQRSAAIHIRDAVEMFASVRDVTGMMLCLVEVSDELSAAGDVADGLRLAGAAAAFERRHGGSYIATDRDFQALQDPRTAIGDDPALAAAWAEGEALTLEDAVALALRLLDDARRRRDE